MKKLLFPFLVFSTLSLTAQDEHYLLIGTYTAGKSEGIYVYKFNSVTADHRLISIAKSSNPSFLAVSPNEKYVYAVNENADSTLVPMGGTITAFSFNAATGNLAEINKQPSGGMHPCYVSIDNTGKTIAVANYTGGSIAVFPVEQDGHLRQASQTIQLTGSGINSKRQNSPHVHYTHFSSTSFQLFATDLGTDKIMLYDMDPFTHNLKPGRQPFVLSKPGSGPRHMAFSQNNKFAYLIEELSGTVVTFKNKNKKLNPIQRLSSLPVDFNGEAGSADIHISPNGKFLYCSNRANANHLSIFSIDTVTGKLTLTGHQSTFGKTPRNFNFDPSGNFLLVANQHSDEIVIFKTDALTGLLTDTGKRITIPNPVCIKWIK